MTPQYIETDCSLCSACRDHTAFIKNEDGEIVSECCDAPPMDLDIDLPSEDR